MTRDVTWLHTCQNAIKHGERRYSSKRANHEVVSSILGRSVGEQYGVVQKFLETSQGSRDGSKLPEMAGLRRGISIDDTLGKKANPLPSSSSNHVITQSNPI